MQGEEEESVCPDDIATEKKTILEDLFCAVALKLQNVSIRHIAHPPAHLCLRSCCGRGSCEEI